jgi:hypothetical protein
VEVLRVLASIVQVLESDEEALESLVQLSRVVVEEQLLVMMTASQSRRSGHLSAVSAPHLQQMEARLLLVPNQVVRQLDLCQISPRCEM